MMRRGLARNIRIGTTGVFVVLLGAVAVPPAQERWSWPEKGENLRELPKDFTGDRLRAVMTGFTRALGVRCSHCHVGKEGQPLSTYDFVSDENPNKNTARAMLRLLGTVNGELKKIEPTGPERVNMWCHTCHRGQPRPMRLAEALDETYQADGIQATVERYRTLRRERYGRGSYDFSEGSLNTLGYALLGKDLTADAIAIFRLNVEFAPQSANAHDSLAEAYKAAGEIERAIAYYQKSLQLDPGNDNAVAMLRELRGQKAATGATAESE